jgi:hypothetical protein
MKVVIKVATAEREFTQDQKDIMKGVCLVLIEYNLLVEITIEVKKSKQLKLKVI